MMLQSTAELARVVATISGDTFWVKVAELTELVGNRVEKSSKNGDEIAIHRKNGPGRLAKKLLAERTPTRRRKLVSRPKCSNLRA